MEEQTHSRRIRVQLRQKEEEWPLGPPVLFVGWTKYSRPSLSLAILASYPSSLRLKTS